MEIDVGNENEVLCEKIINDMHTVFLNDPDLSSFEIIPTIHNCNKSPVKHVEHHLGLDSWCTKHVYDHAHRIIMLQRRQHPQSYLQKGEIFLKYLNVALLINPDVTTFWHVRRQLVQKNRLSINREFQFASLTLSKKPKSNEAFAYRRWLFSFQSSESIDWPNEIGICERCADRSANNYHAWSHRRWVLRNAPFLIKSELLLSERYMQKHLSDYSCCQYRQYLIQYAYEICFFDPDELTQMHSLKELINRYLIVNVRSLDDILFTILPDIDTASVGEQRLKSFLYCCNLAAHDMLLCDAQTIKYGQRESFELHRLAALKFIVEHCVRLLIGDIVQIGLYMPTPTFAQSQQFHGLLRKFDFSSNVFLAALQRTESLHGQRHRDWCQAFLGFGQRTTVS